MNLNELIKTNMTKKMTAKQINKKYKGRYIEVSKTFDHSEGVWMYEVGRTFKEIHENTTLGEDVGTLMEFKR